MKWLILLLVFSGSANAKMFKCVDSKGKTSYSQSPCQNYSETQNVTIHKDIQPVLSTEDKLRRLKNDLAMQQIHNDIVAKEEEEIRAYNARADAIANRNDANRRNDQYRKGMNSYYKDQASSYNNLKNRFKTQKYRNMARDRADSYSRKAREYR